MRKRLHLSAELVARVDRVLPDPGPDPERIAMSDQDYAAAVAQAMAERGHGPLYVFGYGSLLWKPDFDYVGRHHARAHGWHRSFCLKLNRWRGSHEQPGLMMALERGGACHGELFVIEQGQEFIQLDRLMRREIPFQRARPGFRWIKVRDHEGPKRALTFYAGMEGDRYFVKLGLHEQAHMLARAAGHGGSGAAYLHQTVERLAAIGIHDEYLWRLQQLVAAEISGL